LFWARRFLARAKPGPEPNNPEAFIPLPPLL
jgi:hypothetical protein